MIPGRPAAVLAGRAHQPMVITHSHDEIPAMPHLLLGAMKGNQCLRRTALIGERAYVQLTYSYLKLYEATHDALIEAAGITFTPEPGSLIADWGDDSTAGADCIQVGCEREALEVEFYSLNESDPNLSMGPDVIVLPGPARIEPGRVLRADTGEVLAELVTDDYWMRDGKLYSDVMFSPCEASGRND